MNILSRYEVVKSLPRGFEIASSGVLSRDTVSFPKEANSPKKYIKLDKILKKTEHGHE